MEETIEVPVPQELVGGLIGLACQHASKSSSGQNYCQSHSSTPNPKSADLLSELGPAGKSLVRDLILLTRGVEVLEIAEGAVLALTRFSLVRISIRDLVADGNFLSKEFLGWGWGSNFDPHISQEPLQEAL